MNGGGDSNDLYEGTSKNIIYHKNHIQNYLQRTRFLPRPDHST